VYASKVNGRRLTFVVSGMLWGRSLVMMDKETGSLWSHILGKAMSGPLKGTRLEVIPSQIMAWGAWKKNHPDTTVVMLRPSARSGSFSSRMYARHGREKFCVGLVQQGQAYHWRFDQLRRQPVVNDTAGGEPILVVFDDASGSADIYSRQIGDQTLRFDRDAGRLIDTKTRSVWDGSRGVATGGPLAGRRLKRLPAIISFTSAWTRFHPKSDAWNP